MGAFELTNKDNVRDGAAGILDSRDENMVLGAVDTATRPDTRRLKDECIIALKVYDSCRQPYSNILLPAKAYLYTALGHKVRTHSPVPNQ